MDAAKATQDQRNREMAAASGPRNEMEGMSLEQAFDLLDLLDPYQQAFEGADDIETLTKLFEMIAKRDGTDTRRLLGMLEGTPAQFSMADVIDEFELMSRVNNGLKNQNVRQLVSIARSLEIL